MSLLDLAEEVVIIGGAVYIVDKVTGKKRRVKKKGILSSLPDPWAKKAKRKKRGAKA